MGSPFILFSLLDSRPGRSRRAVLLAAHARLDVPAFVGSCVMGSPAGAGLLTWVPQIAPADTHTAQRHSPGAGTASPSQGSCGLSAAEETEAQGGDAASLHVLLGQDAGGGSALLSCLAALGVYSVSSRAPCPRSSLEAPSRPCGALGTDGLGLRLGSVGGVLHALSSSQDAAEQPAGRDPRGGAVGAAGPAVSVSQGAGWAPLPGPEPQVPTVHSWPWFPREVVVIRCVYVFAQPLRKAAGTRPPWAGPGHHPGPSDLPPRSPGGLEGCCLRTAAGRGCLPDLAGSRAWRGFELRCLIGHQGPVRPSPEPCGSCPSAGAFTVPSSWAEAETGG